MKPKFNQLCTILQEQMLEHGVPGAVVGVLHSGRSQIAGFGVTNVDHPLPVTAETIFQIGSNTKTFTATLIMMLVAEGRMELDRPVTHYLPDFRVADPEASQKATVRHLLNHTAGWVGDQFVDTGHGPEAKARYVTRMADLAQLAPFGQLFSYNNAAFAVAGRLIEVVTGQLYEDVVAERIFRPLGMTRSYFEAGDVMVHRFAVGHVNHEELPTVGSPWPLPRAAYSMGAIACTAADLFRYAGLYLSGGLNASGERLLAAAAIQELWSDGTEIDPATGRMGLSWFCRDVGPLRSHRHGGATVGQLSEFVIIPEHDFAYLIFTNADNGRQLISAVSNWLFNHYFGVTTTQPTPVKADTAALAVYVGNYSRPMVDIDIELHDGELTGVITHKQGFPTEDSPVRPPSPRFPVALLPDGNLFILDGPRKHNVGQIIRDTAGEINYLRLGLRLHKKQ